MKTRLLAFGVVAALAALAVGVGAWYFLLRDDAPPPVSLESAIEAIERGQPTPTPSSGQTAPPSRAAEAGSDYVGTWVVSTANSFVGYRVSEQLVNVGAATAVGRTNSIEGKLVFDGRAITSVEVTADLRTLRSDNPLRDGQLRTQALETNRFPHATFVLTSPIPVPSVPGEGQTVKQTVTGNLTLHGVTRPVTLEVEGALSGGRVVVVGSTVIQFADFNIAQPRAASVLSVADHGTLELQLVFERAS